MGIGRRGLAALWLCVLLVIASVNGEPAIAQSYSFRVPELKLQVTVQPDGSARLAYDITFENEGTPIDIIDIGLPHSDYSIGTMSASINGDVLTDIRTSEYIDIGVEIHLDERAIPTGGTGVLHFEATMPDMVYQDTTNKELASLRITPTWFEGGSVQGSSYIGIAVHLPEGIEPDEVLYQQEPFTSKALYQDHAVVVWEWPEGRATQAYQVGVSFPQRVMDRVIKQSLGDLVRAWFEDNPGAAMILGGLTLGLAALLWFRFSGGTGCIVYAILAAGLVVLFVSSPILMLPAIPILIALVITNEVRLKKKPKHTYLPPVAQVEGGGIKRGLTAPESAVLLELPLHKVLTLVMFGLLEKGVLEVVERDPLIVKVTEKFATWHDQEARRSLKKRHGMRTAAALAAGTTLHAYEDGFLDELERHPGKAVEAIDFTTAMEKLVLNTAAKMKGFDLSDTQEYYKRVITRAMEQARSMGEVNEREKYLDKYLPWVMMDESYPTVLTHGGYNYWPIWARPLARPTVSSGSTPSLASPRPSSGRPSTPGKTSFGDVASSFSGWAESTMGGLATAIMPGSMKLPGARGGFIDLSGVDKVTGDVFQALAKSSSSGSRGGKSGGGCACACAGCACACACAGGGR